MPTKDSQLNREITEKLQDIGNALKGMLYRHSSAMSTLTVLQVRSLMYVYDHPGVSMGDLAKYFGITKASANSLVKRLAARKYLKRIRDKHDRRVIHLQLAASAKKAIENAFKKKQEVMTEFLKHIRQEDKLTLLNILNQIKPHHQTSYGN